MTKIKEKEKMEYDVVIVGAGPAGISAGLRASELGMKYIILEKDRSMEVLREYPEGKDTYDHPKDLEIKGGLPFYVGNIADIIKEWEAIIKEKKIDIHEHEAVKDIVKEGEFFLVETENQRYKTRYVIIATGIQGSPIKLGVPGEDCSCVRYKLRLAKEYSGRKVLVVGGGDNAIEAALLLKKNGADVRISYRKPEFFRLKPENLKAIKESGIEVIFNSNLTRIEDKRAVLALPDSVENIEVDNVFVCIGMKPPMELLEKVGIKMENNRPVFDENLETNVKGIFVAGDIAKAGLVKKAINQGYDVVDHISAKL